MTFRNLSDFIESLKAEGELIVIDEYVNPEFEITEITDRISKSGPHMNKALLFTNTGTNYPILINALGSEKRICMALNCSSLEEPRYRIESIFKQATTPKRTLADKLSLIPLVSELQSWMPKHVKKAPCQEVIERNPDVSTIPVLKCWKHDGGRYITLPMVITRDPETGCRNMGMYRMQVIDKQTTGMHWQRNKTGDNHYEAYKRLGKKMPVSVALGGNPANIFSATAPLPENIDEHMLTGFLKKESVSLVRCITNDLEVPADADFILEGYVDPQEELFLEGPFGDHTGFYSLPDRYPKFHITCITHRKQAIYPATIVGIPPMEDAWMGKASERIFLAPIRMLFCPELIDYTMPFAGVAHNLVIAKIHKRFEGQVQKVTNALWGAGQMASNKILILVSEDTNINDKESIFAAIKHHVSPENDCTIIQGALDVLDHSGPRIGFGSKMAIDATKKDREQNREILFLPIGTSSQQEKFSKAEELYQKHPSAVCIFIYDDTLDENDHDAIFWHMLNNVNPIKDCRIISNQEASCLIADGSSKTEEEQLRDIPAPVVSDEETIRKIDEKWESLNIGTLLPSPSRQYRKLCTHDSAWRYK